MFLEEEKFIDTVFKHCCEIIAEHTEFNIESIIAKTYPTIEDGEAGYWQKKNVTEAMNILSRMKLISSRIQPEYTPNVRLLKEVRYGQISKLGKCFVRLPALLRALLILSYRQQKRLLSWLGVFSFLKFCHKAFVDIPIFTSWLDYFAAAILTWLLYTGFRRLID